MLITTKSTIEGQRISRYGGVVAGQVILGATLFKSYCCSDPRFSGRPLGNLSTRIAAGANAIVGMDFDCEVLGEGRGMPQPAAQLW